MNLSIRTTFVAAALAVLAGPAAGQTATDIFLLRLDRNAGRTVGAGPPITVTNRPGYDNQPAFTTDGGLLYTSIRDGQADTYRYDMATGEARRLTRTAESEYSPTPFGGGARFSVVRVEADSTQRLWSFAADGSDPRLLLPDIQPVGYHAWIGTDRVALYVLGDPPTLRLADLTTGEIQPVARRIGRSLRPHPRSGAITFTHQSSQGWRIRSFDPATAETSDVAPLPEPEGYHAWTPDGELLTAQGSRVLRRQGASWISVADLAEHGVGRLTRLTVSPDGRHLAVVADRAAADGDND